MPNGHHIQSIGTTNINWPTLPNTATKAHILPELNPHSLVNIGVLCDHDCTATFTKHTATIHCHNQPILTGPRLPNGLWSLPLHHDQTQHHANTLFTPKTQQQLVQWLHAAAFSPSPRTFLDAIQRNPTQLLRNLARPHPRHPPSNATVKGHLDQQRQRKHRHPSPDEQPIPSSSTRSHTIYAAILDPSAPTGCTYSNLTGHFPVQSNRGANYILVVYEYDSNAIIVQPLRNRTAPEIKRVFQSVVHYFNERGLRPRLHTLDNEASSILCDYLQSEEVEYQLVPPHIYRRNASKRAICTFKNHFIASLTSTDPNFPLSNWCRLLPQAELTLNLLRASRLNPKLLAYAQLEGTFDFTHTPLSPPGIRVIIHEKPTTPQTWAPHGTDGWYLGPALHHYQCYRVWVPCTHAEHIVDTISFFPKAIPLPKLTHKDAAIQATHKLTHALQQPCFRGPLTQFHDDHLTSLRELSKIFHTIAPGVETIAPGVDTTIKKHLPPAPHPTPMPPPDAPTTPTSPQHITKLPYNLHPRTSCPHYAAPITHSETGKSMEYQDLITDPSTCATWLCSASNEFGHLAQGLPDNRVEHTNTIFFIPFSKVPKHKRRTYAHFVCSYRPQKAEPYRTCITVGSNLIDYPGNLSMKVANMTTFKILVNSTLSTPGAHWLGLNINNYYLGTPMDDYKYMFIPINSIPQEIIVHYNLRDIVHNGKVYMEIRCGMYGLPQASILAKEQLIDFLGSYGYAPVRHTLGLWCHTWRPLSFCLIVDDFGVKYISKEHADHLIQCLCNHYQEVDIDWDGKRFCGVHLDWDYDKHTCSLSMPGYVTNALHKFQHPKPNKAQDSPYPATAKQYGIKVQLTNPINTTARLPMHKIKRLQQISAHSYFTVVPSTPLYSLPSPNSPPPRQLLPTPPNAHATNFSTTVPPTPPAQSTTMPVTWSSNFTATPRT